ncbi:MAG: hypothetical protein A2096_12725 [Spirochaetes bacterium GWF1_41_5]|nr:MAG: hypothetical protein A2096_12725 [Spirochaetes bacterium GWF1_41_5]
MNHHLFVYPGREFRDPADDNLLSEIKEVFPEIKIKSLYTVKSFIIYGNFSRAEITKAADRLFLDPLTHVCSPAQPEIPEFDFAAEIRYRPGVTDNEGRAALYGLEDLLERNLGSGENISSGRQYFFSGDLTAAEIEKIAKDLLCNILIEKYEIISSSQWKNGSRFSVLDTAAADQTNRVETINLALDETGLIELSRRRVLSLSLAEMKAVCAYFKQPAVTDDRKNFSLGLPTDVELEMIAQTWSEHCKHKIFQAAITCHENGAEYRINSLFAEYIKKATAVVARRRKDLISVFHDNSGIVVFNRKYAVCLKVETHNTPSALDPYGGAMTGIVGVNRDIIGTGLGAKPIFNTDVFCFADPAVEVTLPPMLLHPKRVFKGVHRGVKDGGNQSGIPTVNGAIYFDQRFLGKPLVFCGTGGIMPRRIKGRSTGQGKIYRGDNIVMVGGRIGKDGIHGATFSSAALTEESPTSAVQIGDPIMQKKTLDFLLEARDLLLYNAITDNGAGGLSSSIGEMAAVAGGAEIDLSKAPLKYCGLVPWEILLSEAQERMTVSVPDQTLDRFLELARNRQVEASVLGKFTDSGYFHALMNGITVCRLSLDFLHNGLPKMELTARWEKPVFPEPDIKEINNIDQTVLLKRMMGRKNIASKEKWVRQYDHEVQGQSIIKPFGGICFDGPNDAAVLKPLFNSCEGLVVACGMNPRYSDIDTEAMSRACVDEAVRNITAAGGDPEKIWGLDNFCWPDPVQSADTPDGEYKLAQLVRACRGLYNICTEYNIPLISGKDSMKNDYGRGSNKISIPPTLLVTCMAKIPDIRKTLSADFKQTGSSVFLIGKTHAELGGSELFNLMGFTGNRVPQTGSENFEVYKKLYKAIRRGLVLSCHDISDGGLAVTLTECCFGNMIGCQADIALAGPHSMLPAEILYSESCGRLIAEVSVKNEDRFAGIMGKNCRRIGTTLPRPDLEICYAEKLLIHSPVSVLKNIWKTALD